MRLTVYHISQLLLICRLGNGTWYAFCNAKPAHCVYTDAASSGQSNVIGCKNRVAHSKMYSFQLWDKTDVLAVNGLFLCPNAVWNSLQLPCCTLYRHTQLNGITCPNFVYSTHTAHAV